MTAPKKVTSWRVCPKCGSRATKLFSINTSLYTCQVCDTTYEAPPKKKKKKKKRNKPCPHCGYLGCRSGWSCPGAF